MVIYHNRAERFDAIIHNVHTYLQDYFHDLNQTIQGMQPLVDQPCENVASGLTAHAAFSPNVRAILLVKNGLAFCSSATGAMNTPLTQLIPQQSYSSGRYGDSARDANDAEKRRAGAVGPQPTRRERRYFLSRLMPT